VNVAAPLPFWELFQDHFATDVSFEDMLLLVDRSTMATSIIRVGRMNENRWFVVALGEVRLLLQPTRVDFFFQYEDADLVAAMWSEVFKSEEIHKQHTLLIFCYEFALKTLLEHTMLSPVRKYPFI
jgi:hypothetical protein